MEQYVLGFAFDRDKKNVVLIEKQKPNWQRGLYNGVGGKINFEESPLDAMYREFKEETGVDIFRSYEDKNNGFNAWNHFATLCGKNYTMFCFRVFTNSIVHCRTMEAERIAIVKYDTAIERVRLVESVETLLPMARDENFSFVEITHLK